MKQLITLSSGVLALSAAFIDKLPRVSWFLFPVLFLSWIALVVSIFFGLQTISAIVKSYLNPDFQWSIGRGRNYAAFCKYGFLVGIALFASFAFVSLVAPSSKKDEVKITIEADDPRLTDILRRIGEQQTHPEPQSLPIENK